jgi:hypothetical protein
MWNCRGYATIMWIYSGCFDEFARLRNVEIERRKRKAGPFHRDTHFSIGGFDPPALTHASCLTEVIKQATDSAE